MAVGTATAIALGLGAAASTASGVAGALANASAQQRAALLQDKAVQQWLSIHVPDPAEQKLTLQNFVQAGQLTPQLETAVKQSDSNLKDVQLDPGLQGSRLRALGALEQQGYGGQQVQDESALQKSLIESGAHNRGEQQAIISSLGRRGQLGSGLELQARLEANQGNNDQAASNSLDIESARRQRALQALSGAGSLAGDIQSSKYNADSNLARARDAINQFNTQNLQSVADRNTNRTNDALQYNLTNRQNIANANTELSNQQQQYNKGLIQKQFDNQAQVAGGIGGAYNNQANQAIQSGKNTANTWGSVAGGFGQLATGVGQAGQKAANGNGLDLTAPLTPKPAYTGGDDENDYYSGVA